MTLAVNPATLIPRPDSETLVEQALQRIPIDSATRVADLGTGSGAIALAVARERPLCQVTATDFCVDALAVARFNARELAVANVAFVAGDWLRPLRGQVFDLVVSNPPYVASDDPHLAGLRYEPVSALDAGPDGLDAIRTIANDAMENLRPAGELLLEHGAGQADDVASILSERGWIDIDSTNDLAGNPRVTAARRPDPR
jgi:release factor glutamine methyltransferase